MDRRPTTSGPLIRGTRGSTPAGPTTALLPDDQERATPCGCMATSGGGGPTAQRAIAGAIGEANVSDRTQSALDEANAWLEARREDFAWSDADVEPWDEIVAARILGSTVAIAGASVNGPRACGERPRAASTTEPKNTAGAARPTCLD